MQIPRPETQQPTLPLEMFMEETETSPGGPPSSPVQDAVLAPTCSPSGVWKTLKQAERLRIKSYWTKMMREVVDERNE